VSIFIVLLSATAAIGAGGCVVVNITDHGLWNNINCGTQDQTMSICEVDRTGQTRPTVRPTVPNTGSCASGWVSSIDNQNCFFVSGFVNFLCDKTIC